MYNNIPVKTEITKYYRGFCSHCEIYMKRFGLETWLYLLPKGPGANFTWLLNPLERDESK